MTSSFDTTPLSRSRKTPLINGLNEIIHRYEGVILDLFGVIHNGVELYPGTMNALEEMAQKELPVVLLSNTPKRSSHSAQDLEAMGIHEGTHYRCLVTAGEAAHEALKLRNDDFHANCGQTCWFMGPEKMAHIIDGLDLDMVDGPENASFILNSMPGAEEDTLEDFLDKLRQSAEKDLPMVCANPDMVVNIGDKQYKCAGTFAKMYEDFGGRVAYHGKPYARVYNMAKESLGIERPEKIIAVGDALHTDIQGANNAGIDSVFNLVGIHLEDVLVDNSENIDMDKVQLVIQNQPHQPTAVMTGFQW